MSGAAKKATRIQRTFKYRGWKIACDASGLIWDICPPDGFYDGCFKSKAAAERAVDKAVLAVLKAELEPIKHAHQGDANWSRYQELSKEIATLEAEARGDFGADDFGVPYRSAQHAAYDRAQKKGGSK
jgi:hypothetical protein